VRWVGVGCGLVLRRLTMFSRGILCVRLWTTEGIRTNVVGGHGHPLDSRIQSRDDVTEKHFRLLV
jgi:hypothetical protein